MPYKLLMMAFGSVGGECLAAWQEPEPSKTSLAPVECLRHEENERTVLGAFEIRSKKSNCDLKVMRDGARFEWLTTHS